MFYAVPFKWGLSKLNGFQGVRCHNTCQSNWGETSNFLNVLKKCLLHKNHPVIKIMTQTSNWWNEDLQFDYSNLLFILYCWPFFVSGTWGTWTFSPSLTPCASSTRSPSAATSSSRLNGQNASTTLWQVAACAFNSKSQKCLNLIQSNTIPAHFHHWFKTK